MKVYIGRYKNWFGPYQLAELLCFWVKNEKDEIGLSKKPDWVHDFGHFLATGSFDSDKSDIFSNDCRKEKKTLLYRFLLWVDSFKKRTEYIKIDNYDTWNMDDTLAKMILPMLIQLQKTKHGSQMVDLDDVPEYLRYTSHEEWEDQKCFDFYHQHKTKEGECDVHTRWDWVMDEMIFAFKSYTYDWEEKYRSGEFDMKSEPCEWDDNGKPTIYKMVAGSNHTYELDFERMQKEQDRINNGLRLFGKYFKGLWD